MSNRQTSKKKVIKEIVLEKPKELNDDDIVSITTEESVSEVKPVTKPKRVQTEKQMEAFKKAQAKRQEQIAKRA